MCTKDSKGLARRWYVNVIPVKVNVLDPSSGDE